MTTPAALTPAAQAAEAARYLTRARAAWGIAGARRQGLLRAPWPAYEAADAAYKAAAAEAARAERAYWAAAEAAGLTP